MAVTGRSGMVGGGAALAAAVTAAALLAGCTGATSPVATAATAATSAAGDRADGAARTPAPTLTPIDPGPPPVVTVPAPVRGEVARVVVTRSGTGKAFRNVPGEPVAQGRTYTVEVACAAGRASDGQSYAVYDAAPGTWGHGEPLYSRPFACDGTVQRTVHLGLPSGRVQIDVRGLPADAVTAYALIRPE